MTILDHDFIEINTENGNLYGGNQNRFKSKRLKGYACGPVAVSNILAYDKYSKNGIKSIDEDAYNDIFKRISYYIPVIPRFGVNGIFMTIGLNLFFIFHKEKRFAVWGLFFAGIYGKIKRALDKDEPVVLAIGPNFPNLFGKKTVGIYTKSVEGYHLTWQSRAHYVTVTGIDSEWIRISTWGREAFINRNEYSEYVKKHSLGLFSNVMIIHNMGKTKH